MVLGIRRSLAIALWVSAVALPSSAAAQAGAGVDRTAAARALFEEGIAAADAGDWESAADRFQRAFTLRPTPQIMFNFAGALVELGGLVRASELLLRVEQDPAADVDVRAAAEERRADVLARLARLTVRVDPDLEDAGVTLDQRRLEPAMLGVALPVDPGAHTVALVVGGRTVQRRDVTLDEGESRELVLQAIDPALGADPLEPAEPDPLASPWLWVAIAGGALLLAVGITIGVVVGTQGPAPFAGSGDPPTIFLGAP